MSALLTLALLSGPPCPEHTLTILYDSRDPRCRLLLSELDRDWERDGHGRDLNILRREIKAHFRIRTLDVSHPDVQFDDDVPKIRFGNGRYSKLDCQLYSSAYLVELHYECAKFRHPFEVDQWRAKWWSNRNLWKQPPEPVRYGEKR